MGHGVVFVAQPPPGSTPSTLAYRQLSRYALASARLADACRFEFFPLEACEPAAFRAEKAWCAAESLLARSPSVVCLSLYVWNTKTLTFVASLLKQIDPSVWVVAGGPEVEGEAMQFLARHPAIDVAVSGEGEIALRKLLEHRLLGDGRSEDVPGIVFRDPDDPMRVRRGAPAVFIEDLDQIPSPILGLSSKEIEGGLDSSNGKGTILETVRGCPHRCGYCQYPKSGRPLRRFGVERVLQELEYLRALGFESLYFADADFTSGRRHSSRILRYFVEEWHVPTLHFECKIEAMSDADFVLVAELAKRGTVKLGVGVQSINREALRLMNRPQHLGRLERVVRRLPSHVYLRWDLIAGLPGDCFVDLIQAIDYIASLREDTFPHIAVMPLCVLPGTAFRSNARQLGLVYDEAPPYRVIRNKTWSTLDVARANMVGVIMVELDAAFHLARTILGRRCDGIAAFLFADDFFREVDEENRHDLILCAALSRMRTFLLGLPSVDGDVDIVTQAIEWRLLCLAPPDRPLAPALMDLPRRVRSPGDSVNGGEPAPDAPGDRLRSTLDKAHVFRFDFAFELATLARRDSPPERRTTYLIRLPDQIATLTEEGLAVVERFGRPSRACDVVRELSPELEVSVKQLGAFIEELTAADLLRAAG